MKRYRTQAFGIFLVPDISIRPLQRGRSASKLGSQIRVVGTEPPRLDVVYFDFSSARSLPSLAQGNHIPSHEHELCERQTDKLRQIYSGICNMHWYPISASEAALTVRHRRAGQEGEVMNKGVVWLLLWIYFS